MTSSWLKKLAGQFGDDIVVKLSQQEPYVPRISTGSLAVDWATNGGYPMRRITEVFGPPEGGKSTMMYAAMASAVRQGGTPLYIDLEKKGSTEYIKSCAEAHGADPDQILISRPSLGTDAVTIILEAAKSGDVPLIVVDSVFYMQTPQEADSDPGDAHVAQLARFLSQNMKNLVNVIGSNDVALIFVNQERVNITSYGSYTITPGGKALKFAASLRLKVRKRGVYKESGEEVGIESSVQVMKNQVGRPDLEAMIRIRYGRGIDQVYDIAEIGVKSGVIHRAGAYYRFEYNEDTGKGYNFHGEKKLKEAIATDEVFRNKVREALVGEGETDGGE